MSHDVESSCCAPTRGASSSAPAPPPRRAAGGRATGLVDVPGGRFAMGYDGPLANPREGEGPVREVELAAYRIGATTVTNQQFATFVKATGHETEAERTGWSFVFHQLVTDERAVRGRAAGAEWWLGVDGADWRHPHGPGSDAGRMAQHPVVHVSIGDAEAYCDWTGTRLPTEAEWERAARGGLEGALYSWGDEHPDTLRTPPCTIWRGDFPVRHEDGPAAVGTTPVKTHRPNGFGLFQASGNVWEWTADPWSLDGEVDEGQRVRRGGSYLCHDSYCNRYRVAARDKNAVDDHTGNIGFRVAA
ncbi:formylglycine-generating enzyme family protein [Nocardioides sp.]|uniref:formylglycine-generating enzyme family protein n=1 Tax=Nocardioides sp. TaxID=35761 RepID=UPI00271EE487|nr:formylglycine-generating enzyme family protein [Nocardioides sp.]MDO9456671.1 formylglycine-generating enzyme family protein [Nocardioides sp.]